MEQSVMSRTGTSESRISKELVLGKSYKIDAIFPYFDFVCKFCHIPSFITSLVDIVIVLQVEFMSLWPMSSYYFSLGEKHWANIIIKSILTVNPLESKELSNGFYVSIIAALLSLLFTSLGFLYYFKNRRFLTWLMFTTQIINEFIAKILLIPASIVFSLFLKNVLNKPSFASVVCIFVELLVLIWLLTVFCLTSIFQNKSPNSRFTTTSAFEPIITIYLPIITIPIPFFQALFHQFPDFSIILFVVLHIITLIIFIYLLIGYGYHQYWSNIGIMGASIGAIAGDIISYVAIMFQSIPPYIPFIVQYSVLLVSVITFALVLGRERKKIINILSFADDGLVHDEKYISELFESAKVNVSERNALLFLRLGFIHMADRFLDFSLMQFILNNFGSTRILSQCVILLSYFPGELRKMNSLLSRILERRDLNIGNRFLVFSLYRLKTQRSSSVSSESAERLAHMKTISRNFEEELKNFWNSQKATMGFIEKIMSECSRIEMLWEEASRDFPNNVKILDEFVRFHCECSTKFDRAVALRGRAEKIENGANLAVDYPFRALVRSIPHYLKKKKLDLKGNIITNHHRDLRGSTSSTNTNSKTDSESLGTSLNSTVDLEAENVIGRNILTQSKVRLALHHAVKNKKSKHAGVASITTAIVVVCTILISIIVIIVSKENIQDASETVGYGKHVSAMRFYTAVLDSQLMVRYAYENNLLDKDAIYAVFDKADKEDYGLTGDNSTNIFDYRKDMVKMIKTNLQNLEHELTDFLKAVSGMQKIGVPVYTTLASFLTSLGNTTQCLNGQELSASSQPVMNTVMMEIWTQFDLTVSATTDMMRSDRFCESALNGLSIATNLEKVGINLCSYMDGLTAKRLKELDVAIIVVPIIIVAINLFPIIIATSFFYREIKSAISILISMPHNMKEENKRPISKDVSDDVTYTTEPIMPTSKVFFFGLYVFVIASLFTAVIVFFDKETYKATENLRYLSQWMLYAGKRYAYAAEGVHETLFYMLRKNSNNIIPDVFVNKVLMTLQYMEDSNKNLSDGSAFTVPCYGFDARLDKPNYEEICNLPMNTSGIHDNYRCSSLSSAVSSLRSLAMEVLVYGNSLGGTLNEEKIFHMLHHVGKHTYQRLGDYVDTLVTIGSEQLTKVRNRYSLVIISILIYIILQICFILFFNKYMNDSYQGLMVLIKHVTPANIMLNKDLLNFLLNRSSTRKDGKMEIAQSVIHESPDSIFCISLNGIVEVINDSVSTTLGYTPEQLLGQPIYSIMAPQDAEAVQKQVQMMATGQASPFFETNIIMISDMMNEVCCNATVLAMAKEGSSTIESFVFIMRDETAIREQRRKAEEAKAKSEKLLYQILPRDIVSMINAGEKDISFSVPSATIIFIDVNKFSEYCASLQPESIMLSLSTLFAQFDAIIKKYPLLTKIKLIGDIYMAAGGLFCKEGDPPAAHAEQGVQFALDCIAAMDSINIKLEASLQVRIGINTGGPLIAGVLGTDKPVFDIIGDPINVAARLQTSDVPGNVQISRATAQILDQNNFSVEPRGEVFLKGKGKQMTYYVTNPNTFMASFSTMEIPKVISRLE